jgi:hypothetical protein
VSKSSEQIREDLDVFKGIRCEDAVAGVVAEGG